jgi:hypothetical protein
MITAIAAAVCGTVLVTVIALAISWLREPSLVDAAAIECGVSA